MRYMHNEEVPFTGSRFLSKPILMGVCRHFICSPELAKLIFPCSTILGPKDSGDLVTKNAFQPQNVQSLSPSPRMIPSNDLQVAVNDIA